jgi:hypothetical protein
MSLDDKNVLMIIYNTFMQTKRIKVKSQITNLQILSISLVALGIISALAFLSFTTQDFSNPGIEFGAYEVFLCCFIFFFIIWFLCLDILKKEYLSDIYITEQEIKLVYKIRDKITKTKVFQKNNIKSFELNADVNDIREGKYGRTELIFNFSIDLIEGEKHYEQEIKYLKDVGNYDPLYRFLEASDYINNFKFNINSENKKIKSQIDYFIRFRKKMPCDIQFKVAPLHEKIIIIFLFMVLLIPIVYSILILSGILK